MPSPRTFLRLISLLLVATAIVPSALAQRDFRIARPGTDGGQAQVTNTSLFDQNDRAAFSQPAGMPAPAFGSAFGSQSQSQMPRTSVQVHSPAPNTVPMNGGISRAELKLLSNHDVVVVIDKSGSMTGT